MDEAFKYILSPILGAVAALTVMYLKSNIEKRHYSSKLRLEKLEELCVLLIELKKFREIGNTMIMKTLAGEHSVLDDDWDHYSILKVFIICKLYFPELKNKAYELELSVSDYREKYRDFLVKISDGKKLDEDLFNSHLKEPGEKLERLRSELLECLGAKAASMLT